MLNTPGGQLPPVADGIVDTEAHGLAHFRLGQYQPDRAEHLDFGLPPEGLGVDQEAVEVEDDRPDASPAECIGGRDTDRQSSFRTTSTMASPASVGLRATVTPAADSASILAWAVPFEPEMMAPA